MSSEFLDFPDCPQPEWHGLLSVIRETLRETRPPRVTPADTVVTTEAQDVIYAILPHDSLGGFSLVAAEYNKQMSLFWATIRTLEYHDDLDDAWGQYTVWSESAEESAFPALKQAVISELNRPIGASYRLQRERIIRLDCVLLGGLGNDRPQHVVKRVRHPFGGPVQEIDVVTSLASPEQPPRRLDPDVGSWFGQKGGRD